MAGKPSSSNRSIRNLATFGLAMALCLSACMLVVRGQGTAAQLLKEGTSYQSADDTSDRAVDLYRQLIRKYPKSPQAESAQFFMGSYYQRKFFILEQRAKVQDWGFMNRAEEELYAYVWKYPKGSYLADAYHVLAVSAFRRGYKATATSLWGKMKQAAEKDPKVYIFPLNWSYGTDDVIKGYCDTASLATASVKAMHDEWSFDKAMTALTNWGRKNCH